MKRHRIVIFARLCDRSDHDEFTKKEKMLSNRNTKLFLAKNVKIYFACLSLVLLCFFSCCLFSFVGNVLAQTKNNNGNGGDVSVDKNTVTFNVSTVDYKDWFDDRCTNGIDDDKDGKIDSADSDCDGGARGLKPEMICDKDINKSSGYLSPFPTNLGYSPCNLDGVHDDYYSTSTANESNVWTSDKNFTVKVNASDSSGIDSIKIEWISGVSKSRDATSYWESAALENYKKLDTTLNPHRNSFTCSKSESCEICVVGGTCSNPVIPTSDLGISGVQQIILFRAIVTDGALNSVATGFDDMGASPKLDKFYRFVVCSTNCNMTPGKCANSNPTVSLVGYGHSNLCSNPSYVLKWKFKDINSSDKPSSYIIEARDKKNLSVVYSAVRSAGDVICTKVGSSTECEMSATLFNKFLELPNGDSLDIKLGHNTYDWRIKVYDNSTENHCLGISDWSPWSSELVPSLSITTPYAAPSVSFTMKNSGAAPKECSSGVCKFLENINFNSTSSVDPHTGIASYEWLIDGLKYGDKNSASLTNNFPVGQEKHTVALTVMDKQGFYCTKQEELSLGFPTTATLSVTPVNPINPVNSINPVKPIKPINPVTPTVPVAPAKPSTANPSWNEIIPD